MGFLPQLLDKLRASGRVFDQRQSRAYSLGGIVNYGLRGGRPYFKPTGWLRYSVHVEDFNKYKDWCVAYHGTTHAKLASILLRGLRPPGETGALMSHGQAYSHTKRTIYLSPSIEYAAFPVYAQLFKLDESEHWGQVVLQCRVRPGAFVERA